MSTLLVVAKDNKCLLVTNDDEPILGSLANTGVSTFHMDSNLFDGAVRVEGIPFIKATGHSFQELIKAMSFKSLASAEAVKLALMQLYPSEFQKFMERQDAQKILELHDPEKANKDERAKAIAEVKLPSTTPTTQTTLPATTAKKSITLPMQADTGSKLDPDSLNKLKESFKVGSLEHKKPKTNPTLTVEDAVEKKNTKPLISVSLMKKHRDLFCLGYEFTADGVKNIACFGSPKSGDSQSLPVVIPKEEDAQTFLKRLREHPEFKNSLAKYAVYRISTFSAEDLGESQCLLVKDINTYLTMLNTVEV